MQQPPTITNATPAHVITLTWTLAEAPASIEVQIADKTAGGPVFSISNLPASLTSYTFTEVNGVPLQAGHTYACFVCGMYLNTGPVGPFTPPYIPSCASTVVTV